ncbi:MAG: response regulator [Lachnospiraceae bacterium]|nr:response regulator [Lachnospiraceae bacterium]
MYTVVVADDEEELRGAILRKVDWESIGFQVVGEAENGVEALELVEKMKPDLLLTDIKMPFVSGIELARQVREIRPTTQIVFLSGFDEFKYAQQAIQYNIISYLLKPISMADLTRELFVVKEKIDNLFLEFNNKRQKQMEKSEFLMPLLLDGYWCQEKGDREEGLIKQALECGIIKNSSKDFRYVVLVTNVTDRRGSNCTSGDMVHSVDSILKKYVRYESFYWNGRIISLLIATAAAFDKYLHILVGDVVQSIERIMNLNGVLGVSRMTEKLSSCHDAYIEAMNAISYSKGNGSGVYYIGDEEQAEEIDAQEILKIVMEVESLVRGGLETEIEEYMERLFGRIYEMRLSRARINYLMVQIMAAICKIIYAVADGEEIEQMQKNMLLPNLFFQDGGFREMQGRLTEFCLQTREMIGSQRKKSSKVLCEKTLKIIETEYGNGELSLVMVSNAVNVSPNYLSSLIKKETGKTFIDLLTARRMETAREMLMCTSMKIREISEKCGYNDQHYFSYCFKKYSGLSPNALRQQVKAEDCSG